MDEEQGNVIDGTARARQWRGSRRRARADAGGELRSDAPKSIASSLLVPASMLGRALAPSAGDDRSARDEADANSLMAEHRSAAGDSVAVDSGHHNLFLAADAAVADRPRSRPRHKSIAALRLVQGVAMWLRRASEVWRPRPAFRIAGAARVFVALSLVAGAVAADLACRWHALRTEFRPQGRRRAYVGVTVAAVVLIAGSAIAISSGGRSARVSAQTALRPSHELSASQRSVLRLFESFVGLARPAKPPRARHALAIHARHAPRPHAPRPHAIADQTRATSGSASSPSTNSSEVASPQPSSGTSSGSSNESTSSPAPSQPPGPTGTGALIGPGSTPSG